MISINIFNITQSSYTFCIIRIALVLLSSFCLSPILVDGNLDKPYNKPASIPTTINIQVFCVILLWKNIIPSIANTTLFAAPTTQYVVADVDSMHHIADIESVTPNVPVQRSMKQNEKFENASCKKG